MKKDIEIPVVEDIVMTVVREPEGGENAWNVYLLNLHTEKISNVFVTSRGYGELDGEVRKTSTLRHFYPEISALDYEKVEPIMENTFGLSNEFWVSFYIGDLLYDKQYVFLPESINENNMMMVPIIAKKGVVIR
ncbi:MAG: hypothetical protein ACRCYO_06035 [Bacteroidia bacterium]